MKQRNLNPLYCEELQEGWKSAIGKTIAGAGIGAGALFGGIRAGANGAMQGSWLTRGTKMAQMVPKLAQTQHVNKLYSTAMQHGGYLNTTNGVPMSVTKRAITPGNEPRLGVMGTKSVWNSGTMENPKLSTFASSKIVPVQTQRSVATKDPVVQHTGNRFSQTEWD